MYYITIPRDVNTLPSPRPIEREKRDSVFPAGVFNSSKRKNNRSCSALPRAYRKDRSHSSR